MKNLVKDFKTLGNIVECLKIKVSVRMEWLGGFVLDGEIEGEKGVVKMNELKKEHARKHVYIFIKDKAF